MAEATDKLEQAVSPEATVSLQTSKVEVNSYRTRRVFELTVDGVTSKWHSVKGGVNPRVERFRTAGETVPFELLFNPETDTWLKIVSPQTYGTEMQDAVVERLKKSRLHQQVALDIAGLSYLSEQVKDVEVEMEGKKVYGFTSPHIGPTLESQIFLETGTRKPDEMSSELSDKLAYVYSVAANLAEVLYLNHGIWFADPNPGNILLREEPDGLHVVLLDFSNKRQERNNCLNNVTPGRYTNERYQKIVKKFFRAQIKCLHQRFKYYASNIGVPFVRDPEEIERNIDSSEAFANAIENPPICK